MDRIIVIERTTRDPIVEKVYGGGVLKFLYGTSFFSRWIGRPLAEGIARLPFISACYGYFQKTEWSRKKIIPFIQEYEVNSEEFLDSIDNFCSFNDFFIRRLKKSARPFAASENVAILPADARYLFYPHIADADGFVVKGQKFNLTDLLQSPDLAQEYAQGSMVMARLCPSDYHRFHFPCDCVPGETRQINGALFSVNPIALKQNVHIFTENRRTLCELQTERFGKVLFMEIGATNVGTIHETYTPYKHYMKGDEKGYFSFGGSSLILLFQPGKIQFDADLSTPDHTEIRGLFGQSLGRAQN